MGENPEPGTQTLIKAARHGDDDAFERLLDRHRPYVLGLLRNRNISESDLKSTEDILQSVSLILWRGLTGAPNSTTKEREFFASITDSASFRRVLAKVALGRCLKYFRYKRAKRRSGTVHEQDVNLPAGISLISSLPSTGPDPAKEALGGLIVQEIRDEVIRQIPNKAGDAVFDHYLEGMTVAESAAAAGIGHSTVERGRLIIRQYLKDRLAQDLAEMDAAATPT